MKKITVFLLVAVSFLIFSACEVHTNPVGQTLIRIHIRANSNAECDQSVKLKVRDAITAYLEDELDGVDEFSLAYERLEQSLLDITAIAKRTLEENGYGYGAKTALNNEYFPTRAYGEVVISSGYYDALIVTLGEGKGDNWWCVIYPPLCFVKASGSGNIEYRSLILELWKRFTGA